jgi:hypothetical protein
MFRLPILPQLAARGAHATRMGDKAPFTKALKPVPDTSFSRLRRLLD